MLEVYEGVDIINGVNANTKSTIQVTIQKSTIAWQNDQAFGITCIKFDQIIVSSTVGDSKNCT
jgi:hypothetical protein